MKTLFKTKQIAALLIMGITMTVVAAFVEGNEWKVPEAAEKAKNPTDPSDKEGFNVGKMLYAKHCKSCHGKEGLGDGPKSGELETDPGDFSSEGFQSQSDGSLYYKTTEGRDDMPSFKKKIPSDEDRWLIVNYLRTLKAQ